MALTALRPAERAPTVSRLRWLALILSSLLFVGLIFALLFIDTRDERLEQQRERDYGELQRIERLLRDATATVVTIAGTHEGSEPIGPLRIRRLAAGSQTPRCSPAGQAVIRLCSNPQDRLLRAEVTIPGPVVAEAHLTPVIDAQSLESRFRHLAVVGPRGEVLLALRTEGSLPPNLRVGFVPGRGAGSTSDGPPADARSRPQILEIAGTAYNYYEVPLDLSGSAAIGDVAPETCLPRQCSLAALVAVPGLAEDFRSLSPLTRALFIGLLVLFLLCTPIVKLITIDRNASLHWLDVSLIGLSVPLITAALTILLLILGHANFLQRRADATSERLAAYIDREITGEIDATRREMLFLLAGQRPPLQTLPIDGMRLFDVNGDPASLPSGWKRVAPIVAGGDSTGSFTRRVPLAAAQPGGRPYFQRLLQRETIAGSRIDNVPPPARFAVWDNRLVVDQVLSIADGWSKLVVVFRAMPSAAAGRQLREPPAEAGVVTAMKHMFATRSLPMPDGFGYAVVNPETLMVLQHRDPSRAHVESFAPQFRRSPNFHAFHERLKRHCASGGKAAPRDLYTVLRGVRYGGAKTNMTLYPACAAGWMIVVWYELPTLEAVAVEAGVLAGAMILIATLIFGVIALLVAMPSGKKHFRWLWPNPSLAEARRIHYILAAAAAWAAFSVLAMALIAGDALLLHALGTGLVLIYLARIILAADSPRAGQWEKFKQHALDWSAFGVGMLLLLAVALLGIHNATRDGGVDAVTLARSLIYLLLVLLSGALCLLGGLPTAGLRKRRRRFRRRSRVAAGRTVLWVRRKVGVSTRPRRPVGSQRRQIAFIIGAQAVALLVCGVVPAAAAYLAAWDAKRLVERDADVERFEAAQAAAVRHAASVLAGFEDPPRLCYRGAGEDPWAPWNGYFRSFQTSADPTLHEHGFARNALRRWFREPARMVGAEPEPLRTLPGIPSCRPEAAP